MTETQPPATQPSTGNEMDGPKLVYILYFVSLAVGVTALAGLIVAYLKRGEASPAAATHYTFLIRTFWIGILFAVIAGLTAIVGIGFLLALALLIWFLVRTIKGFMLANEGKPIPEPETWLW